jgi:hypothetical protein
MFNKEFKLETLFLNYSKKIWEDIN